jgi:hypothetical protein
MQGTAMGMLGRQWTCKGAKEIEECARHGLRLGIRKVLSELLTVDRSELGDGLGTEQHTRPSCPILDAQQRRVGGDVVVPPVLALCVVAVHIYSSSVEPRMVDVPGSARM